MHFFAFILKFSLVASGQSARLDSIVADAVDAYLQKPSTIGLSLGLIVNGTTHTYHFGSTLRDKNSLPTDRTVYEIGSISKTFTGTLLARAIEEKKVRIDDDVRKYLDGKYPNLAYRSSPVRIKHLATHTSGLPPFLPDRPDAFRHPEDSIPFVLSAIHSRYTKEKFLSDLHRVVLETAPGSRYKYANVDAQLAGFILEAVYGKSYATLLHAFITGPLGMTSTQATVTSDTSQQRAVGYNGRGHRMPYLPPLLAAAGGVSSTIQDMLRYMMFHLDTAGSVARRSQQPIFGDPATFSEGLFWRVNDLADGEKRVWHTGGTFGFSSYCVLYPRSQIGIVLLSNEMDKASQGELVDIAERIYTEIQNP